MTRAHRTPGDTVVVAIVVAVVMAAAVAAVVAAVATAVVVVSGSERGGGSGYKLRQWLKCQTQLAS